MTAQVLARLEGAIACMRLGRLADRLNPLMPWRQTQDGQLAYVTALCELRQWALNASHISPTPGARWGSSMLPHRRRDFEHQLPHFNNALFRIRRRD